MTHLGRLVRHLAWVDERLADSLERAGQLDPTALQIFAHVLGAEHVWLSRLTGSRSEVAVWPALTAAQCAELARRNARELAAYVDGLTPEALQDRVTYTNSAGLTFSDTVEDILLHLCLHGAYHRGQVARALREAGERPEPTDYIAFIRGAPAATRS